MKATVLVVEDEEKLRRVIELQLKTAGFEVEQAGSAEDALQTGRRRRPDPHRSSAARHERSGIAREPAPPGLAHAGHRDDRVRKHRDRGARR